MIPVVQGVSWLHEFKVRDEKGRIRNLSSYKFQSHVRSIPDYVKVLEIGVTGGNKLHLTPYQTSQLVSGKIYFFDVIVEIDGEEERVYDGEFSVAKNITQVDLRETPLITSPAQLRLVSESSGKIDGEVDFGSGYFPVLFISESFPSLDIQRQVDRSVSFSGKSIPLVT